jgi:hypothetical protein
MRQNDHFGVGFDTFYDRRSGYMFYANPIGGFSDYSVVDEGAPNTDWNPVWTARTGRFEGGWTIEMQFPFKSLRYTSGTDQVWGIQFVTRTSGPTGRRCRRTWRARRPSTASLPSGPSSDWTCRRPAATSS